MTSAKRLLTSSELEYVYRNCPWWPQEGPQEQAFDSQADVLLYGGAAGGGKTALAVGLAFTCHRETLFIRREATQLAAVVDYCEEVAKGRDGYNGQDKVFRLPAWDGIKRKILFGSTPNPKDETKYQGRPRDLLVIDEAANMLEQQVKFLMGWVRSTVPGQRCRTLLCSNPPTSADGYWLTEMFAPWLDPYHPDPAEPGELRWYAAIDGEDIPVENGEHFIHNNETIIPQSRTFIPAKVEDNAYLRDTGYVATLQAMPEPLRSQMLYGDFTAGREDSEYQVIPSEWVKAAQARWKERPLDPSRITAVGVDPSRGGKDDTVLAPREDWHFHTLQAYPGHVMVDGNAVCSKVLEIAGSGHSAINVDVIGIGAAVIDALSMHIPARINPITASAADDGKDWSGTLSFTNKRSALWWRFRDLLNPVNGQRVELPPDKALEAELCAPTYKLMANGIKVESKDDIKKRLGRSTDRADAVIMAAERFNTLVVKGVITPKYRVKGAISAA